MFSSGGPSVRFLTRYVGEVSEPREKMHKHKSFTRLTWACFYSTGSLEPFERAGRESLVFLPISE